MWDTAKCNLCGDCLVKCQYTEYDKEEAVAEIELLMAGKEADILNKCITCMACNEVCPTGADPFDLICKVQEKRGTSHLKQSGLDFLAWVEEQPNEQIAGDLDKPVLSLCMMEPYSPEGATASQITTSQIFKGMPIVKGADYFCWFGQLHYFDERSVKENAQKFIDTLAKLHKDIVFIHDDCYSMVHSLVKDYGITIPFTYMHIIEHMRNYLRDHRNRITKLGKKVAYQRPCSSRYTPEKEGIIDEIFDLCGIKRVQRKYDRESALCCGDVISGCFPEQAASMQAKNLNDAVNHGADALVTLCAGCYTALQQPASQLGLPSIFITDLCRMALGEKPWPVAYQMHK